MRGTGKCENHFVGLKTKVGEVFENIYKTNKKKQNVVDELNKNLEKQRKKQKLNLNRSHII